MKNLKNIHLLHNLLICITIAFTFWFVDTFTVKAYSAGNPVKSGDSLKGVASIGSKVVGSNYYYSFAPGTIDESVLSFSTQFEYVPIENFNSNTLGGTSTLGFQVNYCLNSGGNNNEVGLFAIYSAYNNSIDYIYSNGSYMYLSDGEWSNAGCFTAFVRLKVNAVSLAFDGFTYYDVSDFDNNFAVKNNSNYDYILRYTDLIYLNETDYQNALNAAKNTVENQTQINQNQTIIDQNQQIIDSDISDSDKELPDDSKFNEYEEVEKDLMDKMNQADLSNLSIGIDSNSSSWIWNTLTRFIQANSIVFGMFISILSVGIIKLALGR